MRLVRPSIEFLNATTNPLRAVEKAGRTCYKSEDKITEDSARDFVKTLMKRGHLAMIEHAWASYRVITDRGVTHEIVRHRLFSYAQESTRYCDYSRGVTFVLPPWILIPEGAYCMGDVLESTRLEDVYSSMSHSDVIWYGQLCLAEIAYKDLTSSERKVQWTPQEARSILPNALKTELVITGNLREWLHFLTLRTAKNAHPQMQEIANMLLTDLRERVPVVFDDVGKETTR